MGLVFVGVDDNTDFICRQAVVHHLTRTPTHGVEFSFMARSWVVGWRLLPNINPISPDEVRQHCSRLCTTETGPPICTVILTRKLLLLLPPLGNEFNRLFAWHRRIFCFVLETRLFPTAQLGRSVDDVLIYALHCCKHNVHLLPWLRRKHASAFPR